MFNRFLMLFLSNVISLAMAQIKRGILGGIQGKVGHLSGQVSKGRNVLTIKPDMSNVVKSSSQVSNNDKFNVLRKLYLNSNETINKITCANNSYKEAGYNFFSRKNYDNFTSSNIVSVNNVFIGNSGLPRVQVLSAKYNSAHTSMTVTYSTSTFNVYGANSKTYCCLYDATNILLYCLPTNYNFFSGTFVIDLPINSLIDYNNLYVSVIASSNTDSKKFSTTLNNWIISSPSISTFNWLQSSFDFYMDSLPILLSEGVHYEGGQFASFYRNVVTGSFNLTLTNNNLYAFPYNINPFVSYTSYFKALVNGSIKQVSVNILPHRLTSPRVINISRGVYYNSSKTNYVSRFYNLFGITNYLTPFTFLTGFPDWIICDLAGGNPIITVIGNNTGVPRFHRISFKCANDLNTYNVIIFQDYI